MQIINFIDANILRFDDILPKSFIKVKNILHTLILWTVFYDNRLGALLMIAVIKRQHTF